MAILCTWCGTEHEAGVDGFCSGDCRQNFNTACRIWAAAEYDVERVSIFTLRTAFYERARCAQSGLASDGAQAAPEATKDSGDLLRGKASMAEA